MYTITKSLAFDALRRCDGNLSQSHLRGIGLSVHQCVTLGMVLDILGCAAREKNQRRILTVTADEAIQALDRYSDDDEIERPQRTWRAAVYIVEHDPHWQYTRGEMLSRTLVSDLIVARYPITDGLELTGNGERWRLYHGRLWHLTPIGRGIWDMDEVSQMAALDVR